MNPPTRRPLATMQRTFVAVVVVLYFTFAFSAFFFVAAVLRNTLAPWSIGITIVQRCAALVYCLVDEFPPSKPLECHYSSYLCLIETRPGRSKTACKTNLRLPS